MFLQHIRQGTLIRLYRVNWLRALEVLNLVGKPCCLSGRFILLLLSYFASKISPIYKYPTTLLRIFEECFSFFIIQLV